MFASRRLEAICYTTGVAMAGFVTLIITLRQSSLDLCSAIVGIALFGALGFVATWIVAVRRKVIRSSITNRLFIPLIGFLYFPAAHFVGCRLAAYPELGEFYATRVSVFRFTVPWVIIIAAMTALSWKRLTVGTVWWHWWLAGAGSMLSFMGEFAGVYYLGLSNTGRLSHEPDVPQLMVLVACLIAHPVLIGMTFNPIHREVVIDEAMREQDERERAEQARMLNAMLGGKR